MHENVQNTNRTVEDDCRDLRLDYVKAIAITLVLVWHLKPIVFLNTNNASLINRIIEFEIWQFYLQVSLVAVPLFLLVSLYLFYTNVEAKPVAYLKKRCFRLTGIFTFWTGIQFAAYFILKELGTKLQYSLPKMLSLSGLLMQGGPQLPIVGGSVFYFLFALLLLTPLSFAFFFLKAKKYMFWSTGIIISLITLYYFESIALRGNNLQYWRIDNFLIYIPLAYFLLKSSKEVLHHSIPVMWTVFILFSLQDIFLRLYGYPLSAYSRISIVFLSLALFSSLLNFNSFRELRIVSFLAKYSLGIFALHKYYQLISTLLLQQLGFTGMHHKIGVSVNLDNLLVAIATILFTFLTVSIIGRTPLKVFVQ